jgi:repressor LexA
MNDAERRVLMFIRTYVTDHGYPPSVRDICKGCNYSSPGSVAPVLDRLAGGEYIEREYAVARGLRVLKKGWDFT